MQRFVLEEAKGDDFVALRFELGTIKWLFNSDQRCERPDLTLFAHLGDFYCLGLKVIAAAPLSIGQLFVKNVNAQVFSSKFRCLDSNSLVTLAHI